MAHGAHVHTEGLNTKLVTKQIVNLADAAAEQGHAQVDRYNKYTVMVLVPERSCCTPWIIIPEGFHAIVISNGAYVGIWKAGFHWARPWERVSQLVTKQFIVFDSPVKECPTMDNVMVQIDVSMVVSVKDDAKSVSNFVFKLGPERLEAMLRAFQEEAVRSMARNKRYSNIYDLMDTEELPHRHYDDGSADIKFDAKGPSGPSVATFPGPSRAGETKEVLASPSPSAPLLAGVPASTDAGSVELGKGKLASDPTKYASEGDDKERNPDLAMQLENTKRSMNDKLKEYGVEVYSITITNVHLPDGFRKQMEEATTFSSRNLRQVAEQGYNLQVITAGQLQSVARQRMTEIKAAEAASNESKVSAVRKIMANYEAETEAMLSGIVEKARAEQLELETNSQFAVAVIQKEKEFELAQIDASGTATARQIAAEMNAFVLKTNAAAVLEVARNEAEITRLKATAEAVTAPKLVVKRDFEAKMQQLRVLKNLASNRRLALSGTNKDNIVAQMIAAKSGSTTMSLAIDGLLDGGAAAGAGAARR